MIEIPLSKDTFQEFSVVLTKNLYIITLRLNSYMNQFLMDVSDASNRPIVFGLPCRLGFPIGLEFLLSKSIFPRGYFIFGSDDASVVELTFETFSKVRLYFDEVLSDSSI